MKLFFWKKTAMPSKDRVPSQMTTSQQGVMVPQRSPQSSQSAPITKSYHRILPLKNWCESELTPLAWSRIVIRMLPILRDFNCNFNEIQNPSTNTVVEKELFKLFLATSEEIYDKSYITYLKSLKETV